jgi:hypothetical protein
MISQETFDEMVQENMEDFEMEKDEALSETIKQLTSMGRDLSAIDTTGGKERGEIIAAINCLKNFKDIEPLELIDSIKKIDELCGDKYEFGKRNQNILRANGGMGQAVNAIDISLEPSILVLLLELLSNLCRTNGIFPKLYQYMVYLI